MNFWYLLLFVILGNAIMFLMDWVALKRLPTDKIPYYGIAILLGGLMAYFIRVPAIQALIMVVLAVGILRIIRGVVAISGTTTPPPPQT